MYTAMGVAIEVIDTTTPFYIGIAKAYYEGSTVVDVDSVWKARERGGM